MIKKILSIIKKNKKQYKSKDIVLPYCLNNEKTELKVSDLKNDFFIKEITNIEKDIRNLFENVITVKEKQNNNINEDIMLMKKQQETIMIKIDDLELKFFEKIAKDFPPTNNSEEK